MIKNINWNLTINLGLLILLIQILIYAKIKFGLHFFLGTTLGDEEKYLEDILFYKENGLYQSIVKGVSITFLILSSIVDKFFNDPLLSLRSTSLLSSLVFFLTVVRMERKFFKLSIIYRNVAYISIIYIIVLQGFLFAGINDLLLDVFASLIFIFIFSEINNNKNFLVKSKINFLTIGVFLGLMLCTRKMSLVYIPSFILVLFLLKSFKFSKLSYVLLGFLSVIFLLNYPSIIENGTLSFDDKVLKSEVSWSQFDYYNMLIIQEGHGVRGQHVELQEVEQYLDMNGAQSLPNSFFSMIFFNPKLTIIEFFYGLKMSFIGFLRSLGLLFIMGLFLFKIKIKDIFSFRINNYSQAIILFGISFTLLISFIVISYIQFRWFMVFLPFLIIGILKKFEELKIDGAIKNLLLLLHIIGLFIMNIPFLLKAWIP